MTKYALGLAVLLSACAPATSTTAGDTDRSQSDREPAPAGGGSKPAPETPATPSPSEPPAAGPLECTRDTAFPAVFPIAEASGAAELTVGGKPQLLVAADSKNAGAAVLLSVPAGVATKIVLPLDPNVSDDIEGLAPSGGAVYALTSAGAVTRFLPDAAGSGFTRDGSAYRIGASPLSCSSLKDTNCGKNWEGLCLRRKTPAAGECAGYAASKEEGALYCVTMMGTTLSIDAAAKSIALALPAKSLSDCSFGANALVITTNDANASKSYIVDEKSGKLEPLPVTGLTSNEAVLLAADGTLYQFEDASAPTSAGSRFTCKGQGL